MKERRFTWPVTRLVGQEKESMMGARGRSALGSKIAKIDPF